MKFFIFALFSLNVFANKPIQLDSPNITLSDNILTEAIFFERNIDSPDIVEVTFPANPEKVCTKYEPQQVFGEHASCGTYVAPSCRTEEFNCEHRSHCTQPSELFGCQNEVWDRVCQYRTTCNDEYRTVSCNHMEQKCTEYKEVPVAPQKTTLIFKLKNRQKRKTHLMRAALTSENQLHIISTSLFAQYDYSLKAWVFSK